MKKILNILALSAAVLSIAGCVKQTTEQPHSFIPGDGVVRVAPAVGSMTRAVSYATGAYVGDFGLSIARGTETDTRYVCTNMKVTDAGVMASTLYWKDSSPITVTAYAPFMEGVTGEKAWSVPDNQSAVEPADVDFLYVQKEVDPTSSTALESNGKIPIELQHKMSKLTVTLTVDGSLAGTYDNGGIAVAKTTLRDMTVSNVLRHGTVNVATGAVATVDNTDSRGITHLAPDEQKTTFEGIFFPQSTVGATADDDAVLALNILYRTSSTDNGIEFPFGISLKGISWTSNGEEKSFTAFETNKHYKIALKVSSKELTATLTVVDWGTGTWDGEGSTNLVADAEPIDPRIHIGSLPTSDITWAQFVSLVNRTATVTVRDEARTQITADDEFVLDENVSQNSTIGAYSSNANSARPMNATFDGDGHTITLAIGDGDGTDSYQGLFAYVTGTVKNLNLTGSVIFYKDKWSGQSAQYIGAVAGCNDGTIGGINSSVTVSGYNNVGGIAGDNNYRIDGCSFTGTVNGEYNSVCNQFGGIAGNNSGSVITLCSMEGTISGSRSRSGIAYNNDSSSSAIVGCWTVPSLGGNNYGGIVDTSLSDYGTVSYCYTTYLYVIYGKNTPPANCKQGLENKAAVLGYVNDMNAACASGTYASSYKFAADGSIVAR